MSSFMSNFFPAGKDKAAGDTSPGRPGTPSKTNSFINPPTPHGSPSKKTLPPGANDLSSTFDNAMNLNDGPGVKLTRPQSVITPLSPGKSNVQPFDDSSTIADESVLHKGPGSGAPLKKQGQENTPPATRLGATDSPLQHSHAAVTRQQLYEQSHRPLTPHKKFNTSRGLTAEERDILQKPNIKRLVNVAQLCMFTRGTSFSTLANRLQTSSITTSIKSHTWAHDRTALLLSRQNTLRPRRPTRKPTTKCGQSTPAESERTFERGACACDTATSKS